MISKNLKVFEINGRSYQFNIDEFRLEFARKAAKNNCRIGEYEQMLADSIFVSKDSVHNWRQKLNGPGDMDKIKKTAEFLGCDMMSLMTDVTEENTDEEKEMNNTEKITLNDRQRDAVKRVYLAMLDFINDPRWQEWGDYTPEKIKQYEENGIEYEIPDETYWADFDWSGSNILDLLEKEFIDIPFELWNELTLYYWENISGLYRWEKTYKEVRLDWIKAKCEEGGMSPEEIEMEIQLNSYADDLEYELYQRSEFVNDVIRAHKDSLRKVILPYL
ncbi:MAG: hypothetical protein E7218_07350 [Anaerofustis stercorihominis]|nr:hypothetical protein [Anaerofustis stercorihominis]